MAPQIPKHEFGHTGAQVSVVGMGGSPFGNVYGTPDEGAALAAIKLAFENGVNFFDVAPVYAGGAAEELMGRGLAQLPREQIFVSSKVGKYKAGEPVDFSAGRVQRSVRESLQRLGLDYLDMVHCHDIEFAEDMKQIVEETLPALAELKAQGLVRHLGITGLPLDIFRYILDRVPAGTVDAVLSYCHNNLADNTLTKELPYLESKQVAVISASFSSMGLLTQRDPPLWHPASEEVKAAAVSAKQLCAGRGTDLARLAIKHFIRTPGVHVHLMGMATPAEVEEDLKVVREALGLVPEPEAETEAGALKEVQAIFAPVMDQTWPTGRQDNRTP